MLGNKKLNSTLEKLPQELRQSVETKISLYEQKLELLELKVPENNDFFDSLAKVWCCSEFVAECCIHSPKVIDELVLSGDLFSAERRHLYSEYLSVQIIESENTLMSILRKFRCREMLRIAWRDLASWSDLNETLYDLTQLAEVCIQFALDYLYQQACELKGIPVSIDGTPINIVVLGMGKLGAWELNYSSDIDLIFAYAEEGVLDDRKNTTYGEFFSRICRKLVKILDERTAEGFVFRTDIRLRPFGDSGPIIMTFDGMENYYLTQAREWERYAMVKARQVAGDFISGKQLSNLITPFVYRRYLDYGAFEELRSLKSKITQELMRKDRVDNIKLGPGGIREIEFIGQAFQLIRGGQDTELQERSILKILKLLGEMQLLTQQDAEQLQQSYCFLRQVENHIQQYQDKQTHDLPTNKINRQILAFSMGFSDWESFDSKMKLLRTEVHNVFEQVFSISELDIVNTSAENIWAGICDDASRDYLQQQGFKQIDATLKVLNDFKNSRAITRLTTKGAAVVERLLPQLIEAMDGVQNADISIKRMLDLFEQVAGRNVYLSLLAENPDALLQLLKLSSSSPWICAYLAQYPVLFDELLDTRSLYEPLKKEQLTEQLSLCLDKIELGDMEQRMIKLRQFKQVNVLRIAAADLMGIIPVMVVSDYLTYVAEVIVDQVINNAWKLLVDKHGLPVATNEEHKAFAVLGFGKLGGIELGYGSDLDMVFLYTTLDSNELTQGDKPISCSQFYARLGQKVRHILDTRMLSGVLYEVDMRLRPSGESGLLVTHINSYENYLKNNAWTWEHQALVRGRFIAGDDVLKQKFDGIRKRILSSNRDISELKKEISEMRDKMRKAQVSMETDLFDIKQSKGGIVDIEFIVQFYLLAYATDNIDLTIYTDNIGLLETFKLKKIMSALNADILKNAYCDYRGYGHHQVLKGERAMAKNDDFEEMRNQVKHIWHETFNESDNMSETSE